MPSSKSKASGSQAKLATEGNVDQIRDILFGGQMREYERRFRQTEDRHTRELERLQGEMADRISSLETFVRNEFEKLSARQKQEKKERLEAEKSLETSITQLEKSLRAALSDLEGQSQQDAMEIRNQIHNQGQDLLDQLRKAQSNLRQSLEQETQRLYEDKVSREELSGFLKELALRLTGEFTLPQPDE